MTSQDAGGASPATWRKVGVRAGDRLCLLGAPGTWDPARSLAATVTRRGGGRPCDVVVACCTSAAELRRRAGDLARAITPSGMVWVAWPRKAAGHASDLSDAVVRATMLPLGLVDVKVAALDEDWSALKLVWRLERRGRPAG